jgi:hypothetical protein
MGLVFTPILFVVLILYVASPFLVDMKEKAAQEKKATELEKLRKAKEDAVATLKDIDMDYRMGKLSENDYETLKVQHQQRAVEVLQKLEVAEKKERKKKKR